MPLETLKEELLRKVRRIEITTNRLVTDMRGIPQMQEYAPVVFDATHSVQEPGGLGNASGGRSEYAPLLALAALGVSYAWRVRHLMHKQRALQKARDLLENRCYGIGLPRTA